MGSEQGWFKPGHTRSKGIGRPSLPSDLRIERKENQAAFIRLVARYLAMTDEEMLERHSGPDTNQLEGIIFGMIGKAKEGDVNSAKYLVETMTGKIPEADEFSEDDLKMLRRIKEVMDESRKLDGASNSEGSAGNS